jgi:PAS domain S-box-containing protein
MRTASSASVLSDQNKSIFAVAPMNIPLTLNQLKTYASFLLQTHLQDVATEYLNLLKETHLPLLTPFYQLPKAEMTSIALHSMEDFLRALQQEFHEENTTQFILGLHQYELPEGSRQYIQSADIVQLYSIRRKVLLTFIPLYTAHSQTCIAIALEVETLHTYLEQQAFKLFLKVHHENIGKERDVFASLVRSSIDGIMAFDQEFKVLEWNEVLESWMGISRDRIIGKRVFDVFPHLWNLQEQKLANRIFAGETIFIPESPFVTRTGFYEANIVPLYTQAGDVTGGLSIIRDISDQKELETKQQENSFFLEKIIQSSPNLLYIIDLLTPKTVFINENVEHELGYTPEQMIAWGSQLIEEIIHPDDIAPLLAHLDKLRLASDDVIMQLDHRVKDSGGSWRWFRSYDSIFKRNNQGQAELILSMALNITEQKQNQEELQQAYRSLQETNEELMRTDDQLRELNSELERRVRDRTKELMAGEEELRQALKRTILLNERFRENELFLSSIIDQSPVPTWIANNEGTQIRVNDALTTLFASINVPVQTGVYNLLKDEQLATQPFFKDIVSVFKKGKIARFEQELRPKDTSVTKQEPTSSLYLITTIFPIKDTHGRVTHAVVQHENNTDRRKAEKALVTSEERYRQFVQQSSEAIWRFELDGIAYVPTHLSEEEQINLFYKHLYLAECNDQMARMHGFASAREIVGARLETLLIRSKPENRDYLRQFIREGYRLADAMSVEPDKDGNTKYFLNNLLGIFEEGKLVRAWGTQRDISSQHKAEEALRIREEQLHLLTDALPVLIIYVDADERYRFTNKAYSDWFGFSREQVYGKQVREIVGTEAYVLEKATIQRALNGEAIYLETEVPHIDAGCRFVSVNYIPHIENKKVLGYYTLTTDITNQKTNQRALEEALRETEKKNEELNRINADLDNFVYTASHDLRSPIANIEGLQQMLEKRILSKLDSTELELMRLISVSVHKLNRTIRDLTEIVKIQKETGQQQEPISFAELLEDIKVDLFNVIAESEAHLEADFEVTSISYASKHIRSILYNLVSNAIKYRDPHRPIKVHIRTQETDNSVVLTVADNGLGIEQSQLDKVFMMFKRLHTHVEGSGVGLYMVKRIVENNGGRVMVESEKGKGSLFKILLKKEPA